MAIVGKKPRALPPIASLTQTDAQSKTSPSNTSLKSSTKRDESRSSIQEISHQLLTEGNVNSFVEFFYLSHEKRSGNVLKTDEKREGAEDESLKLSSSSSQPKGSSLPTLHIKYTEKPILPEDEKEKLIFLEEHDTDGKRNLYTLSNLANFKELLKELEKTERGGVKENVFIAQRNLAKYFQSLHNYEFAIERFKEATETAKSSKTNIVVEALYNIAFALEEYDKLDEALSYYEQSRMNATETKSTEGERKSSEAIIRVHTKMATRLEEKEEFQKAIEHHLKSVQILKESIYGEALLADLNFRLGNAYRQAKEYQKATEHLESYLRFCKSAKDHSKEGLAQVALASCHEQSGNPELAITQLKQFIEQSTAAQTESSNSHQSTPVSTEVQTSQKYAQAQACHQLGVLYTKLGQFSNAVEYLERHYRLVVELNKQRMARISNSDTHLGHAAHAAESHANTENASTSETALQHQPALDLEGAKALLGIARTHAFLPNFKTFVTSSEKLTAAEVPVGLVINSNFSAAASTKVPTGMTGLLNWKNFRSLGGEDDILPDLLPVSRNEKPHTSGF